MADETRGRPIIILGPPRSGTTLLGLMLQSHPRIAIPAENRFLLPTYFARATFGDLSEPENRRRLGEAIVGSKGFDDLGLDPAWVVERVMATGWTVGAAFGQVLRAHADRFGKVRWGDKRPAYRRYIWVIERLFPNAQFVNTIRDGRDCVASMGSHPVWEEHSEPNIRIREWVESVRYAETARERLSSESFYDVRYENLVTEPEKELRGLCDYLGEEFDEAMLRPGTIADEIVPERMVWHANTRNDVSASSVGGFAERLTESDLRTCETIMGDQLRELGYALSGVKPASDEQVKAYTRIDAKWERGLRDQKTMDHQLDYPWPVADMAPSEAELHRTVAEFHRTVAELHSTAAKLRDRSTSLAKQRDQARTEIDRLTARNATLTKQRNRARARLERVLRSRTWRWTEPLRAALRTLRRRG
jgi:hypothetical protein